MTHIKLRSIVIRGSTAGNWRADTMPLTRWPEAPRYCPSCGCRLRRTNLAKVCDPCDDKARAAHEASEQARTTWLEERGL